MGTLRRQTIAKYLRKGKLIVLVSTTYPGTTDEDMRVILEETGMKAGQDFYLAYSPEREDPSNQNFSVRTVPKVVGGYSRNCLMVANALFSAVVTVYPSTLSILRGRQGNMTSIRSL